MCFAYIFGKVQYPHAVDTSFVVLQSAECYMEFAVCTPQQYSQLPNK